MERLQLVQNSAARLLTGTCKFQHITPILSTLQWLPVKLSGLNKIFRVKILTLVFKALHNLAPTYLTELLHPHKSVRPLRSRSLGIWSIPRSKLKHRALEHSQLLTQCLGTVSQLPSKRFLHCLSLKLCLNLTSLIDLWRLNEVFLCFILYDFII